MPRKKSTEIPDVPAVEILSKISKVRMLSPSLVLLEIPTDTNTDLPVWDAVRSQRVDVEWTVGAYSIGVVVTPVPAAVAPPKAPKGKRGRPGKNDDARDSNNNDEPPPPRSSSTPEKRSPTTSQPRVITLQHVPLARGASNDNVLLTVLPSSHVACFVNPFAPVPVTNNSFFCPLPLIISQPPPPPPAPAATSTQRRRPDSPPPAKRPRACASKYKTKTSSSSPPPPPPPAIEEMTHTKQPRDIQICDEFLLNLCRKGESCEMHHTPYPFHWQLFEIAGAGQWVDLKPDAQLCLERHYCSNTVRCFDVEEIIIKDGLHRLSLDLALMRVNNKVGHKYTHVRRLSNTSDPARNPHFPTRWRIYCRSISGTWEEYPKEVSKLLLGKMADKEPECTVQINGEEYTVNFGDMTQTRISKPGRVARVLCRPTYRSPASMEPHLHKRTGTPSEPPAAANFNVDPLKAFACWYPPVWSLVPHQDYRLVDVPTGTQAFLKVQDLFHQSLSETEMEITSIQQVQNLLHWDKFQRHRAHMEQNSKTTTWLERHAFHGTAGAAVPQICRHNFDPRVSGTTNGAAFGEGSYFSLSPSYCHPFSPPQSADGGVRHMFLAKVLVGSVTRGRPGYRRPPPVRKNAPLLFYDTCVDCVSKPSIFVVFDSCQCYPYYLIKYKELPRVIDITE